MAGPYVRSDRNRTILVDEDRGYERELSDRELAKLARAAVDRLAFLAMYEATQDELPPGFDGGGK